MIMNLFIYIMGIEDGLLKDNEKHLNENENVYGYV